MSLVGKIIYIDGSNRTIPGFYVVVNQTITEQVLRLDRGPWKGSPNQKHINILYDKNSKGVRTKEDIMVCGPSFFIFVK